MSSTIQGGRPLIRGRLFGFPIHLDLTFVLVMGFLGYYPGVSVRDMVLWLLITPLAVLTHELGHAVFARAAGAEPSIALAGFGGVTTYVPPRQLSRGRSLGISLAGPAVGLVLGGILYAVQTAVEDSLESGSAAETALRYGIFTCIVWSLFNLLPVLPLDGGQAMRELLPGAPAVRLRRARLVSAVTAAAAAVVAYFYGQPFAAIFLALFAVTNGLAVRDSAGPTPRAVRQSTPPEDAIVGLLLDGQPAKARELLASVPPTNPVDLAVHGAVLALTGEAPQGLALLRQELQRRPAETKVVGLLLITHALLHEWDGLIALMQGPAAKQMPATAVERAAAEARGVGREDVARRLELLSEHPAT